MAYNGKPKWLHHGFWPRKAMDVPCPIYSQDSHRQPSPPRCVGEVCLVGVASHNGDPYTDKGAISIKESLTSSDIKKIMSVMFTNKIHWNWTYWHNDLTEENVCVLFPSILSVVQVQASGDCMFHALMIHPNASSFTSVIFHVSIPCKRFGDIKTWHSQLNDWINNGLFPIVESAPQEPNFCSFQNDNIFSALFVSLPVTTSSNVLFLCLRKNIPSFRWIPSI